MRERDGHAPVTFVLLAFQCTSLLLLLSSPSVSASLQLSLTYHVPGNVSAPVPLTLRCSLSQNASDDVQTLISLVIEEHIESDRFVRNLARSYVYTNTPSSASGVEAEGDITGDSGHLIARTKVQAGVAVYVCKAHVVQAREATEIVTSAKLPKPLRVSLMVKSKLSSLDRHFSNLADDYYMVKSKFSSLDRHFSNLADDYYRADSCAELRRRPDQVTASRQKVTWSDGTTQVLCDTDTDGGGWTIFQRRMNGLVDFYKDWADYEKGFGSLDSDFWLGLRKLRHLVVREGSQELRVELEVDGKRLYALYHFFELGDSISDYQIRVSEYSGTAGNSLLKQNGLRFSTKDRDHDIHSTVNCAVKFHGAWWYEGCHNSNLNGLWGSTAYGKGLNWRTSTGYHKSATFTEMKVRPLFF